LNGFSLSRKYFVPLLLFLLLEISSLAYTLKLRLYSDIIKTDASPPVNVGVAFCGNTTAEAKLLIDRVQSYTNLFVMDTAGGFLSRNQTSVEEICDYAVAKGLKIIINMGTVFTENTWFWQSGSLDAIKQRWRERWGENFLGIYYNDEPARIDVDTNWKEWFNKYNMSLNTILLPVAEALREIFGRLVETEKSGVRPQYYDKEAEFFIEYGLKDSGLARLKEQGIKTFTSDYCLYWYDYQGGFDVMWAQLGWNSSSTQQIDLVKGAARLQNKDWGAIITWKYTEAPYLDTGEQIYSQMMGAYEAGADYIVIFNYPKLEGNDYGAMTDEHFNALERFWNNITKTDSRADFSKPEAALVLPQYYGSGMRRPDDTIWGFWGPDEKSLPIAKITDKLLEQYGLGLDIVYADPAYPISEVNYKTIYYWNSTT
jgi:hypothetical protein